MFARSLEEEAEAPNAVSFVPVTEMEQLVTMVAAGYTPYQRTNSLEYVKNIGKKLNDTELFEGVDIVPQPEREGRELGIFTPWQRVFFPPRNQKNPRARHARTLHTAFMFRLPFATTDVLKVEKDREEGAGK